MKTKNLIVAVILGLNGYAQTNQFNMQLSGNGADSYIDHFMDASGNHILLGNATLSSGSTIDLDPTSGTNMYSASVSSSITTITKLNPNGTYAWTKVIAGAAGSQVKAAEGVCDNTGNVYFTGSFLGQIDLDPSPATLNTSSNGNTDDIFTIKLDGSGNFQWGKIITTANSSGISDAAYAIALDPTGNVYIAGVYEGTADFNPGVGQFTLVSTGRDGFVQKLDNNGNFIGAFHISGINSDVISDIVISNGGSNFIIAGYHAHGVDVDPGAGTVNLAGNTVGNTACAMVVKYNATTFVPVWAKDFTTTATSSASELVLDANNDVYISGNYKGTIDVNYGTSNFTLVNPSTTSDQVYVCKYSSAGSFVWGNSTYSATSAFPRDINYNNGALYLVGRFDGTIDLNYAVSPGINTKTSNGGLDAFIWQMNPADGSYSSSQSWGGTGTDEVFSIEFNNSEFYTAGTFASTVDFDFSISGTQSMTAQGSGDGYFSGYTNSPVGLNKYSNEIRLSIVPNPNKGVFQIAAPADRNIDELIITDMSGKTINYTTGMNGIIVTNMEPGLYILTVRSGDSIFKSKINVTN